MCSESERNRAPFPRPREGGSVARIPNAPKSKGQPASSRSLGGLPHRPHGALLQAAPRAASKACVSSAELTV